MEQYIQLLAMIKAYTPSPIDLLRYLRRERDWNGDEYCTDEDNIWIWNYQEETFWGTYHSEVPRDQEGFILVDEAFEWTKCEMDGFYAQGELAPFVRTMMRTEAFKQELLSHFK